MIAARIIRLNNFAGRVAAGPGPLEIVAAQPAGDIDDFANEIKAGHGTAFHRLGGECCGVHTPHGYFRLGIAAGIGGYQGPVAEVLHELIAFTLLQLRERLSGSELLP